ncbi:MAG: flagellar hook-basal body complex protein FliE [Magnetovibrionaceae bacterium]
MATPAVNIAQAAQAYQQLSQGGPAKGAEKGGDSFADLVQGALEQAREIGRRGEDMSLKGVTDRADVADVVNAVAEAELTLQTVVAVRDKVIESYKQVMRMPM